MIWKLPQQSNIMKMAHWSAKNLRHMTYLIIPIDDFGCRPKMICTRGVGQTTPKWIVSRYLPTTTRGLTKTSNNFQPVFFYPLEYWHLTPEFLSEHIMLLAWVIVPDSKSNSSSSFGLFSWEWHWVCDIVSVLYYTTNRSFFLDRIKSIVYTIYGRFHPTEHGFRIKKKWPLFHCEHASSFLSTVIS